MMSKKDGKVLSIFFPLDLYERLHKLAVDQHRTFRAQVIHMLIEYFEQLEGKHDDE